MNKYIKHIFAGLVLAGSIQTSVLYAIPADPSPRVETLPDGTTITVCLCGDETFHYYMTEDGFPLIQDEQGFFYYAQLSGQELVRTSMRAQEAGKRTTTEKQFLQSLNKGQTVKRLSAQWKEARQKSPLIKAIGESAYPTTGEQQALAILVQFPKIGENGNAVSFTIPNPRQTIDNMLNQEGFSEHNATGSVYDYYYDNSGGKFKLHFDVYGPVTLNNDISFYGARDEDAWQMVVEACQQLDDEIDFTQYDRDKDGMIDNVYIFYAGEGEATGGASYTIWQHASDVELLAGRQFPFDGVRLNHYACSNEIRRVTDPVAQEKKNELEGIGTVCHEFTHVLGFPDLYDTENQISFTPGAWSIMDAGSHNNTAHTPPYYTAYERFCLGWLELEELSEPADIILEDISKNQAYRISTVNENEFFVLENRQLKDWDLYIPGHGMLVWHITYDETAWSRNEVNTNPDFQRIDIVEADNEPTYGSRQGDAFPGTANVTEFTDDTQPSMMTLDGLHRTEVPITDIVERNGFIQFKVKGGKPTLSPVTTLPATDVTPISFVAHWGAHAEATAYKLDVYRIGQQGNEYVEGYQARLVEDTQCAVTGLQPETTYYYRVKAVDGNNESAHSTPVEVTTEVATFEYIAPSALAATDITGNSFVAHWESLAGAQSYKLDLFKKVKGIADTLKVDFTDKKLPEGWRTDCQMFLGTNGYYGEALPSLSMTTDYNYIESPVLKENIRGISFWYRLRNNPSGNNQIVLSGWVNDEWVEFDVFTLDSSIKTAQIATWSDTDTNSKIPANCKAIRITFRLLGKGALAIDDICLAYNDKFSTEVIPDWGQKPVGTGTSYKVTGLTPSTTYYYTVRGVDGDKTTIPSNEIAVTTTDDSAIDAVQTHSAHCYVNGRVLTVTSHETNLQPIALYDLQGRIIAVSEPAQSVSFELPAEGCYLVKVGNEVYKVFCHN